MAEGEAERGSLQEITKEQRVVFVLHREELSGRYCEIGSVS
jgi:hypothetical protein